MKRPNIREKVPDYLRPFIAEQDPSLYTAIDHASWRYIMRVSKSFFAEHAHQKYLDGLVETGIETESIPSIEEMDRRLERFGWRACAIVGFIPPAVFMEFLSLGILPIACDIRRLEHIGYTPSPDIVHEAAGHAPIIADQDYADYLYQYGEIARKVIFSSQDVDVYEAIRGLSDIKEDPASSQAQIAAAQKSLDEALAAVSYVSEATLLSRMGWWTIEYGLVGELKRPKIYGAGLLSSVSESFHCLSDAVEKIPFSIDCINTSYDITKPQPQLYVTPDFDRLRQVLEEFSRGLSFRRGGITALETARKAATVTTTELETGLQIGGIVDEILRDARGDVAYIRFRGPCQLACRDHELEGHGPDYHAHGFGTPLGLVKGLGKPASALSSRDLELLGGRIEFESGVIVSGQLVRTVSGEEGNLVLSFENCKIHFGDRVLFEPAWGTFDMACGTQVVSVFGGAPDRGRFLSATGGVMQKPGKPKTNETPQNKALAALYARVRALRTSGKDNSPELDAICAELDERYSDDWLLRLELLELGSKREAELRAQLAKIAASDKETGEMIKRGLALL